MKRLAIRNFIGCMPIIPGAQRCRLLSTSTSLYGHSRGLFEFAPALSKAYIKVLGPDAPKFLNGLVMSKLVPHYVKKNLTTINPNEPEEPEVVPKFDNSQGNWGVYVECSDKGPYVSRFGIYTGILNSKGKLISDTIIYPTPLIGSDNPKINKYPTYLLEFDSSIIDHIYSSFTAHRLTSKVKIKKFDEHSLKSWDAQIHLSNIPEDVLNPWIVNLLEPSTMTKSPKEAMEHARSVVSMLFNGNEDKIEALYLERRIEGQLEQDSSFPQVLRIVTKYDVEDISLLFNPVGLPFEFDVVSKPPQFFRKSRFEAGYVDSTMDFKPETLLPLELNFDCMPNAVSKDKGCYVGQELTARTFATGILRKRLVPVDLENLPENNSLMNDKYPEIKLVGKRDTVEAPAPQVTSPFDGPSTTRIAVKSRRHRERPAGLLIAHEGDKAVALLRIEHFSKAFSEQGNKDVFYIEANPATTVATCGDSRIGVVPHRPLWTCLLTS